MGYHLCQLSQEAGLPEDVLPFLPGGPAIGKALIAHLQIHVIAFTGSKDVGLQIIRQAAQVLPDQSHVKRAIAEMGRKNAIIVDETAELNKGVSGVRTSLTGY